MKADEEQSKNLSFFFIKCINTSDFLFYRKSRKTLGAFSSCSGVVFALTNPEVLRVRGGGGLQSRGVSLTSNHNIDESFSGRYEPLSIQETIGEPLKNHRYIPLLTG